MNKKPTQCDRILRYINDFGSITTRDAFMDLGIMRLGARISELRSAGYDITDKLEKGVNRYNEKVCYKRYFLGSNG